MKKCSRCKIEKELTEYHKNRNRYDGLHEDCKDCRSIHRKKKYADDPIKYKEYAKYGINQEIYTRMKIEQDNKCAICGNKFKEKRDCSVDHDHKTGKVRALLCSKCNKGI